MAAISADHDVPASEPLAHRQRVDACLRALEVCDWDRLTPLAQHMADKRLVRARGDAGAPLRRLDVQVLRKALSRMLAHEWEDGYLIYHLVVEGAEPSQVAAERGVSRATLVEQLRDAVGSLACQYEQLANGHLNQWLTISLQAAPVGKRAPGRHSSQRHGTEDRHHKDQGHADPYHP